MPAFRYRAVGKDGGAVSGTMDAENRTMALRRLVRGGLQPLEVAESAAATVGGGLAVGSGPLRSRAVAAPAKSAENEVDASAPVKLKSNELIIFTEELSDLLEAGLPLEPALRSMERRGGGGAIAAVSKRIREAVIEGGSFGAALRRASPSFDELYCSLAMAGEASGALPSILARQAKFLTQAAELRSKVVASLIYPAFLVGAAVVVTLLFLVVLLPNLTELLRDSGAQLPLGAQLIMGAGDFARQYWWLGAAGVFAVILYCRWWLQQEKNKPVWDAWRLKAPLVGPLLRTSMQVQFLETLANLTGNGLPLLRALELTRNTFANRFVRDRLGSACEAVADGASFSRALSRAAVFPPELVDMVSVGEHTGDLPAALFQAGRRFDRELSGKIQRITALIQPVVIVIMALVVGSMVYLMITAIFESLSGIGNVQR